jgi:lysozyme
MHPDLKKLLEREEGVVYAVYEDHLGLLTCGVGHLIVEGDAEFGQSTGTSVSADRVDALLETDLKVVEEDCGRLFNDFNALPVEIQLVCEAMVFQLGRSRLAGFVKFRAAIDAGQWSDAADEMVDSRWYGQTTRRAQRLVDRVRKYAS